MKGFMTGFILFLSMTGFAQKNAEKATFKVNGNCEMCKQKIEKAALVNGVSAAVWNIDSKIMRIKFSPDVISLDSIQKLIAQIGYDTEKYRADDLTYSQLHKCCLYERNN